MGEAGAGKTSIIAGLLEELVALGLAGEVTLIDMAPARLGGFGGKVADVTDAVRMVRYISDDGIYAPRLMGSTSEEVEWYAEQNRKITEAMLKAYMSSPTEILMINDLTLHLHKGDVGLLLDCVKRSTTFVGSAYRGVRLADDKGSGISGAERRKLSYLAGFMDRVVDLSDEGGAA